MSEIRCKLKYGFDKDGPVAPVHTHSRGACAQLHVCHPVVGPQKGSGGSSDGPPGQPPVLGLVLGPAAGDELP